MKPINNSLKPYSLSRTIDNRRSVFTRDSSTVQLGESRSPDKKVKLFAIKTDKIAAMLKSKVETLERPEKTPQPEILNNSSPFRDILDYDLFQSTNGYRSVNLLDAPKYMLPLSSRKVMLTNDNSNLSGINQPPTQIKRIIKKPLPNRDESQELLHDKINLIINLKQNNNFFIGANATPLNHKPETATAQNPMMKTIHSSHGFRLPKLNAGHGSLMRKKKELSELVKEKRRDPVESSKNEKVDIKVNGINFKVPIKPRDANKFRLNIDLSMQ